MSQDECLGRAARHGAGWSEMRVDVFFGRERFLFDSGKKCFVGTLVIKVRMPCLTPPLPVSPSRAKLWAEKGEGLGAVYVGARRGGGAVRERRGTAPSSWEEDWAGGTGISSARDGPAALEG